MNSLLCKEPNRYGRSNGNRMGLFAVAPHIDERSAAA
jgi:hypothetical protein